MEKYPCLLNSKNMVQILEMPRPQTTVTHTTHFPPSPLLSDPSPQISDRVDYS